MNSKFMKSTILNKTFKKIKKKSVFFIFLQLNLNSNYISCLSQRLKCNISLVRAKSANLIFFHLYTEYFSSSFRMLFGFDLSARGLKSICEALVVMLVVVVRLLVLNHRYLLFFKYIPFLVAPGVSISLLGVH